MDSTFGVALSGLFGTILALAVVLGLAYVSIRAMRHWQDRGLARGGGEVERRLRFVRALPLGQRERLVLVEAEGELLLVGVSAGSVNLIRSWGGSTDTAESGITPVDEADGTDMPAVTDGFTRA